MQGIFLMLLNIYLLVMVLFYTLQLVKKKRVFQRAVFEENEKIFVTDTPFARRRFLKSGIRNVIMGEEAASAGEFMPYTRHMYCYNEEFVLRYLADYIANTVSFLKMELPLNEIALSSEIGADVACRFAKMVTVCGSGEDEIKNGVYIRRVKRIKSRPDIMVFFNNSAASAADSRACIDLREKPVFGKRVLTWETMSFAVSFLPFEISGGAVMYLIGKGYDFEYRLTSVRKKLPPLFTFS